MCSHQWGYAVKKRIMEVITRRYPTHSGGERRESIRPFGISMDATKVVTSLQICNGYGAVIGSAFPYHFIPITNMSEDHVQEILDGKSKEYGEIPEASEEKAALKPFLNPTLGYPRTYFVHSPIMNGKGSKHP